MEWKGWPKKCMEIEGSSVWKRMGSIFFFMETGNME